jgi:hypothetical protein
MGPRGTIPPAEPLALPEGFRPILLERHAVQLGSPVFRRSPGRDFQCAAAYLLQ